MQAIATLKFNSVTYCEKCNYLVKTLSHSFNCIICYRFNKNLNMSLRVFAILFFLGLSNVALSETVDEVKIIGLNSISRGTVLSYIPVETGDEYSESLKNDSIASLLKTNLFSQISITFDNNAFIISLTENPTIKYFEISGYENDEVLNDEVISEIKQNYQLNPGDIFSEDSLTRLIKSLQELYQSQAFYKTEIKIKTDKDEKNRIGIELVINENNKALINSMRIKGSKIFSEEELLDLFDIGEPDIFLINYFTERDNFSSKEFSAGLEKLRSKYLEVGFLDFKILESNVTYNPSSDDLNINISVNEGKQYKFNSINFIGNFENLSIKTLNSFFDVKTGENFDRKKIVKGIKELSLYFNNLGYPFASVNSRVYSIDEGALVNIDISLDLDKKTYINRIIISGNHTTQDDVIRRKMSVLEGGLYSKEGLDQSISQIRRLGYFSEVKHDIKRHRDNKDQIDIFINVTEAKTGEITLGLSHSNSTGGALTAGISQNNILGTGNTLKAAFSSSDAVSETSLYFLDPHFNKVGHSISYGFFNKKLDAANIDASSYILDESGFNFGYGVPVTSKSRVFGEFRSSKIDLTCGLQLKNIDEIEQCNDNKDLNTTLSFTYSSNSLDDYYFASNGSKSSLTYITALPLADYKYFKLQGSYKSYQPILDDKVFKFSSRINLASGYGGDSLPFYERFYEGGTSSVRGFDFNSLGAKYVSSGKPKGGELSIVSSIGVASSLAFAGLDNNNMRLSVFVDAGTISEKKSNFKLNDFRASTGLQFSWLTPIGPIGLHYALPLIKKAGDKTTSLSFELGASF